MKLKKVLALALATAMTLSLVACGGSAETTESTETTETTEEATEETTEAEETTEEAEAPAEDGELSYGAITLGESYTDITTTIKWIHHKTDREEDGTIANYIAEFNKVYPNITVETEGITDYQEDALLRLSTGDWGDIMFIPSVDKAELATYFVPFGTTEEMGR